MRNIRSAVRVALVVFGALSAPYLTMVLLDLWFRQPLWPIDRNWLVLDCYSALGILVGALGVTFVIWLSDRILLMASLLVLLLLGYAGVVGLFFNALCVQLAIPWGSNPRVAYALVLMVATLGLSIKFTEWLGLETTSDQDGHPNNS
jgi:hypothetical protein